MNSLCVLAPFLGVAVASSSAATLRILLCGSPRVSVREGSWTVPVRRGGHSLQRPSRVGMGGWGGGGSRALKQSPGRCRPGAPRDTQPFLGTMMRMVWLPAMAGRCSRHGTHTREDNPVVVNRVRRGISLSLIVLVGLSAWRALDAAADVAWASGHSAARAPAFGKSRKGCKLVIHLMSRWW